MNSGAIGGREGEKWLAARAPLLLGLLGRGIGGSLSPTMHQAEGDAAGLRIAYKLLDFDVAAWPDAKLGDILAAIRLAGFRGTNVTFPFKQAIMPLLDELSPEAAAIGAVNTIVFEGGRAIGFNTDATGFAAGLRTHVDRARWGHVVLFGGGGAGSAAAHAMLDMGVARITLVEPDEARRNALTDDLARRFGGDRVAASGSAEVVRTADGVVNATPIGMAKLPGTPVDPDLLTSQPWVYDIIYVPADTELLRAARDLGCQTLNGVTMVVNQGAEAYRHFTGVEPDLARMESAVIAALG